MRSGGAAAWLGALAIAAAAAGILLLHLGAMPLWGSEGRWGMIARAMLRSGDPFRPQMGASLYWDKPLLSYWQVLPFARLLGGVDEASLRLPSALWALASLGLTLDLARRWHGPRAALLAAMALAGSLGFVFWGRNAQVEMTNAAVILLASWIFVRHRGDASHRWVYALGAVAAIGANMKGLPAYGAPAFCILLVALFERDWSWLPPLGTLVRAGLLSLGLYLALPALESAVVGSTDPFALVWQENVLRFFHPFDHTDPVWTYPVRVFDLFAPWSLLLPPAIALQLPALRRRAAPFPEALLFALGILLFFTLSGSRRPYYILPILPFLAILVGALLDAYAANRLAPPWRRWIECFGVACGAAMILPLVAYPIARLFSSLLPIDLAGLGAGVALLALAGVGAVASARRGTVVGLGASVLGGWLGFAAAIAPWAGALPGQRSEAAQLRELGRPCAFLGMSDERLAFYLDRPYAELDDEAAAFAWARERDGIVIAAGALDDGAWREVAAAKRWRAFTPRADATAPAPTARRAPVARRDDD